MATLEHRRHTTAVRPSIRSLRGRDPAFQAYSTMYLGYIALPILAGADKFFHYLVDWNKYLAPQVSSLLGGRADLFMRGVGVVEIIAGLLVMFKPRLGALVVGLWLMGIVGNLLMIPGYFDIALRDFGLALGAFALSRLASQYDVVRTRT